MVPPHLPPASRRAAARPQMATLWWFRLLAVVAVVGVLALAAPLIWQAASAGLGLLALVSLAGIALWMNALSSQVQNGIATGRQEGFALTQVDCVNRAIDRAKRGAASRPEEVGGEAARLVACLQTSERVSGFCAEVPGERAVLDRATWTQLNCSRIDVPRQHGIQLLDAVVTHCSRGAATATG